ncbi:putative NAD/FAD-binding protein [Vibrio nigripulchritudo SO65]|uniref:NAD(P)-binding protein n=1 Tax=Vibrio nigripulchritudo TaxID=28173 RepID=UPI0003B2228E|nr:NAD(P)-binding protein [Vibrio nigripulchritudo]CCN33285.1 putative NAD/FAD-binding protein [Vibrio nigripulchritudo AM115]CCN42325.1 putative NAD/FAD-binding protein [Vibrio nigripulchritudo FTn2]CCN65950.1 putative NAD/FAD-binding protein [Vibrio nigripulchritudo POn4]CCN75836.1 putative NAD/FAD-binding protein [Vibrio nigripulchritudo SO65]
MQQDFGNVKNIAVIGGGTSGLATCYYLYHKLSESNQLDQFRVHLFEKEQELGGNAHTVVLNMGKTNSVDSEGNNIDPMTLVRWADMGVNDVNFSEYHTLKTVMTETEYFNERNLKPIEDTACFFSQDNQHLYTDDIHVSMDRPMDRRFSLSGTLQGTVFTTIVEYGTQMSRDKIKLDAAWGIELHTFFGVLIALAEGRSEVLKPELKYEICLEAFNEIRKQPSLANVPGPELAKLIIEVRDNLFFPRVAAMFFTSDKGPQHLPLASPFGYFSYQEGKGAKEQFPDRRYFVGGTKRWIEHLTAYLLDKFNPPQSEPKLFIYTGADVKFKAEGTGFTVASIKGTEVASLRNAPFDAVVSTIHANHARTQIAFDGAHAEQGNVLDPILARIKYTQSIGIVHTDASVISSNVNSWRTFNVSIRHGEAMVPYSITFQENRHQNDWCNPNIRNAPELSYFVTLNPTQPIADKFVLRTVDSNENLDFLCGTDLTELPESTQKHLKSGNNKNLLGRTDNKAIFYFAHNVYDKAAHQSQLDIEDYHTNLAINVKQNGYAPIVYAGSWCAEVGLQETCWKQAENAVDKLLPVFS